MNKKLVKKESQTRTNKILSVTTGLISMIIGIVIMYRSILNIQLSPGETGVNWRYYGGLILLLAGFIFSTFKLSKTRLS